MDLALFLVPALVVEAITVVIVSETCTVVTWVTATIGLSSLIDHERVDVQYLFIPADSRF